MGGPDRSAVVATLALALAALGASCSAPKAQEGPRPIVVVVTPAEAAAPVEFRGAEALVGAYSAKDSKVELSHAVLPGMAKPGGRPEAVVASFIAEAASDARVKAIVVDPALPGSAEGLRRSKLSKPGLLCVSGGSREDVLGIEASADLVVDLDRVYRAYLIPWAAKKMGAKALVAAYAQGEYAEPASARERAIMSAASADLGLRYAAMTAPSGADAAAYARAMTGAWLRDYGPDASLYCSDGDLAGTILAGAIAGGGIVVDEAGRATRAAYAAALGIDLGPAKGDAGKERKLLERALAALGGRGRYGEWDADYAEACVEGLGEFALRVVAGAARKDDLKDLVAALDARSPGAAWIAAYDVDPETGVKSANRVLVRQDVYVFGSGYLQSALQAVPEKYLAIRAPGP
jgi:hypothetical protein